FTMTSHKGANTRIDDLVIEGGGVSVKGSVELDPSGEVAAANFPLFAMSGEDKATLKAERQADGGLKGAMGGDVHDGRTFIKSVMGGGAPDAKQPRRGINDLDVDVKVGAVAGFHGEALRGLELRLQKRAGLIKGFALNAKHGAEATLMGDMRGPAGGRP